MIITLVFILAWTSDFIDGRIARKLGIDSKFGANLDLFVDCVFVFTLNLQLLYFKLIPFVFILIMVEKIANYLITSKILNSMYVCNSYYCNDKIGRVVSASFFVVPWFVLILNSVGLVFCNLIIILIIRLIIGFSIISSFGRYYRIIKAVLEYK